jgi:hypothetical protein
MKGALDIAQERDPDFFTLLEMHTAPYDVTAVVAGDGAIEGCGSVVVRDGWMDHDVHPIAYLCDLRFTPRLRGGTVFPQAFRRVLELSQARHGAELFYCAVIDSNEAAMAALLGRDGSRSHQPFGQVMTPYHMVSVQFTARKPAPSMEVRRHPRISGSWWSSWRARSANGASGT